MKEKELRELAICSFCDVKLFDNNYLPMFWKLKISQFVLDQGVLQRQTGLEMMMGGHVGLAQVFSTNEDMAKEIDEEKTLSMCMKCMTEKFTGLGDALENLKGEISE